MRVNADEKMMERLQSEGKTQTVLLHSCCAPCSTTCLERIKDYANVTVFYYNPNIDEKEEYEKRKAEQIRLLEETGWAKFLDCDHDVDAFLELSKGLEQEPERGKRCYLCYGLRLKKTAEVAKEKGFTMFATTLSVSPYKNAEWLNELGEKYAKEVGVEFLPADFKKRGGYYRSQEWSKRFGLYRQDFCGCSFSKIEAEEKRKKKEEK